MTPLDKTLLLAEKFGADSSYFTSAYVRSVLSSPEYKGLVENVASSEPYPLKKAIALREDFKHIDYGVSTFEEGVYLSTRVNYLYSVSDVSFYYNPLMKYDVKPELTTVGELRISYRGKKVMVQQMIDDKEGTLAYKAHAISEQCGYYRDEAAAILDYQIGRTQQNKGLSSKMRLMAVRHVLLFAVCLVYFVLAGYSLISRRDIFVETYTAFSPSSLSSWGIVLFDLFTVLAAGSFFLTEARWNTLVSPYRYFARFRKHELSKKLKALNKSAQRLADDLYLACKEKKHLEKDLSSYEAFSVREDSIRRYLAVYRADGDGFYLFLKGLVKFFLVLATLALLYLFVLYLIWRYTGNVL
jgi:hypothetical protein